MDDIEPNDFEELADSPAPFAHLVQQLWEQHVPEPDEDYYAEPIGPTRHPKDRVPQVSTRCSRCSEPLYVYSVDTPWKHQCRDNAVITCLNCHQHIKNTRYRLVFEKQDVWFCSNACRQQRMYC